MDESEGFFAQFGDFVTSASQAASQTIASLAELERQRSAATGDFVQTSAAPPSGEAPEQQTVNFLGLEPSTGSTLLLIGGIALLVWAAVSMR